MQTLKNIVNQYLNYCKVHKNLDSKTIKAYRIDLEQFLSIILADKLPIDKDTLMIYLSKIHEMYQPRTVKRKIASVKAFFHYLEYEEIIETNPFNKIAPSFRQTKRLPKTIPANTIQIFLSTLYKKRPCRNSTPVKIYNSGYRRYGTPICH